MKIIQEGPVLDKMKEITSKVVDGVSKAGDTARNTIINAKNTVDYLKGNRDTRFSYDDKGTVRDVRNTALKAYANEAGDWKIDKDSANGMLRVRFDAKKVSTNLANRVNPSLDRSDSLASYITGYDRGTNTVTMEVPLDGGSSAKKKAQKKLDKRKKESTDHDELESVMTPTPIPYKGEVCDKDGKLIKKESLTLKTESEDLLETPGLTLSVPEVVTSPKSGDSLVIKINGKEYKYVLPETSDKSVSDIARTVTGIQKHSEGRALAYLKKNMKLVKESIENDDDEEVIKSIVRDVNRKGLDRDSEEYINQIESELKKKNISVDADQLGSIIVGLDESLDDPTMTTEEVEDFYSKELSEGNSFKDSHICQGCGNPLSQCTCDTDTKEEDIDFNALEEGYTYDDEWVYKETDGAVNSPTWVRYPFKTTERLRGNKLRWVLFKYSLARNTYMQVKVFDTAEEAKEFADNTSVFKKKKKECTQPSSIGQYKTDSINLIDSEEDLNE